MKTLFPLALCACIFFACTSSDTSQSGQNTGADQSTAAQAPATETPTEHQPETTPLTEVKNVKILWQQMEKDTALDAEVSATKVNTDFIRSAPESIKAILAYYASLAGSDCFNNQCVLSAALGLGEQCSDKHINLIKKWFGNDQLAMDAIESCYNTPNTATVQSVWDALYLDVSAQKVTVRYKKTAINMRENKEKVTKGEDQYQIDGDRITVLSRTTHK